MAFNVVVEAFIEDLLSLECLSYIQIKIPTIEQTGPKHRVDTKGGDTDLRAMFLKTVVDFTQEDKIIYIENKKGERPQFAFFSPLKTKNKQVKQKNRNSIMEQPVTTGEECIMVLNVLGKASNNDENVPRD